MKKLPLVLLLAALAATSAVADVVYVTSTCSNATSTTVCASAINVDLNANGSRVYTDAALGFTSAVSTKPDGPLTPGGRYFGTGFTNSSNIDTDGFTLNPILGVPGGVYRLFHIYSSAAANINTNGVLGATNVENCTLSFDQTDKFQSSFGVAVSGTHVYQFLGYVTNNAGTNSPKIRFYYKSGLIDSGLQRRLVVDTFKFALDDPCLGVPGVGITGPLGASLANVIVTDVNAAATKITVWQDSGSGFVSVGTLTSGIVAGNNAVPVTGLVKGAKVTATQTLNGVDGCTPLSGITAGKLVGGGPNPTVRLALSVRETTSTGPVGAPGSLASSVFHFLGTSTRSGFAPTDSQIISPSTSWQTITLSQGRAGMGSSGNVTGAPADDTGIGAYVGGDTVAIRVYAFKTVGSQVIYSATGAESSVVTSNAAFVANWSWNAVSGAEGYRLLRNFNGAGFTQYQDVGAVTSLADPGNPWVDGNTVTPSGAQLTPSWQWNPTVVQPSTIATKWAIIESLAFSIADATDTGPFDLYIDNLQNGATVFETYETAPARTTDYGFRAPSFSGTTSGFILAAPNVGAVVNNVADTGTKSFRVNFQWQSLASTIWLRLTTSGAGPPQVNLDDPITIRLLLLPVGASLPTPPPAPTLTESYVGGKVVLNWTGGHRLQTSVAVPGTYTNVPQVLSPNVWTNITLGAFLSPWTNNFPEPTRFFRLLD